MGLGGQGYALTRAEAAIFQEMLAWWRRADVRNSARPRVRHDAGERELLIKAKITSAITTEPGRYNGKIISWPVNTGTITSGASIAVADLGTISSDEDVLIWNLAEIEQGGHAVDLSSDAQCAVVGYLLSYDDATGKAIIAVSVGGAGGGLYLRITNSALVSGETNLFAYSWEEVIPDTPGRWTTKPSGKTHTSTGALAYNGTESPNSDTGEQGNGAVEPLPTGLTFKPLSVGGVYRAFGPLKDCDGNPFYFVEGANMVWGDCS